MHCRLIFGVSESFLFTCMFIILWLPSLILSLRVIGVSRNSWFATTWQGGHVGGQYSRIFSRRNLHENRVQFPEKSNVFVLDHKHDRREVMCKPAIPSYGVVLASMDSPKILNFFKNSALRIHWHKHWHSRRKHLQCSLETGHYHYVLRWFWKIEFKYVADLILNGIIIMVISHMAMSINKRSQ